MKRFSLVFAVATLGMLVVASSALAVHARPLSATPLTFQLVPAFNAAAPCPGTNSTHGAPLNRASCNPPVQTSQYLTSVSPDRAAPYNLAADGTATIILKVTCLTPGTTTETGQLPPCSNPGDQIDVKITSRLTGVRCVGAAGQGNCAGGAASLYNGKVLGTSSIEITDHNNNNTGQTCDATTSCPASVTALPFNVGTQCSGGACNYVTSADSVFTNGQQEGKRAVVELGQIQIQDAGLDGNLVGGSAPQTGICPPSCAQTPDGFRVASVQGLFVP